MSEERETPASRAASTPEAPANLGAPVEETEASETEVLEAVGRATGTPEATTEAPQTAEAGDAVIAIDAAGTAVVDTQIEAPHATAVQDEGLPTGSGLGDPAAADPGVTPTPEIAEQARRQAISEVDTQLEINMRGGADPTLGLDELPSAAAQPARDGEIRIATDHPMAALYMQSPIPPEIRGNRGAGVLIALVATLGFALVSAGVVALAIAPDLAPSQFVNGLLETLMSWGFIIAAIAFFVGLSVLVLVVGRAGWWAYILGGFLVGLFVWAAATAGFVVDSIGVRALVDLSPADLVSKFGTTIPAIAAGIVAREVTVWFGAWIGARGRRMKQRNADALTEYEAALAEVQAKQP